MCAGRPLQKDIAPEHLHSFVPRLLHDLPLMWDSDIVDRYGFYGSVSAILGLKPELHLYDFLVTQNWKRARLCIPGTIGQERIASATNLLL